jgi:hypothetical protein
MLLEIPHLVRDLIPRARSIEAMSVACVHTTRPKYLVFAADNRRPAYVVQFGPGDQMERTHHALVRLHPRLPDVIAQPLVCAKIGADEYVQIQAGLPGLPWFRVADLCRSRKDWLTLIERGLGVLARLQAAIAECREWNGYVHPGRALRERVQTSPEASAPSAAAAIEKWAEALDRLGYVPASWQHGDFSVNNLLIGASAIGVIDFDEFGETMMPLHDEIGLALSFPQSQPDLCPLSTAECLQVCLRHALRRVSLNGDCVRGLVLHHLLLRIESCSGLPSRAGLRARLARSISELIDNPDALFADGPVPNAHRGALTP